ncbi:hypothetical protein G7Y89_g619 [Cudoniella acicularis]|uniref:EKC/KEOPS complex subunit CGI121 n=1 Tax=Cudoniella acicularis TaxID=354080 RepID=A0A8H4W7S1_9HELO|nr:hypothetical protein G7Y89_g619 [Cudoniella acicularis]
MPARKSEEHPPSRFLPADPFLRFTHKRAQPMTLPTARSQEPGLEMSFKLQARFDARQGNRRQPVNLTAYSRAGSDNSLPATMAAKALLETVHLEHVPASHAIHITLYRNITNASFLQQQLLAGNTSFEYALIDASVVCLSPSTSSKLFGPCDAPNITDTPFAQKIVSRLHVLAAAFRAINDSISGRLRSRNVHSEIVFSLSPNNNIAESFRRFGITPDTTSLLIIKVSTPTSPTTASEVQAHLDAEIQGEPIPFTDSELAQISDIPRIKKIYKLNNSGNGNGGGKKKEKVVNGDGVNGVGKLTAEEEKKELEVQVLGAMALRGATN